MRRSTRLASALFVLVLLVFVLAFALGHLGVRPSEDPEPSPNDPSSAALIESPDDHNGATVMFTGEAIGEAMIRGDHAWLHLNDDAYYLQNVEEGAALGGYNSGMAVWIPASEVGVIAHFGDYRHEGDVVAVEGVFNAACAEHGGDMDIHAASLRIVQPGREVVDPVSPAKVLWAAGLGLLAVVAYLVDRFWLEISLRLDRL